MHNKNIIGIITLSMTLAAGCTVSPDIKESSVRDRVYACGAGFSKSLGTNLTETFDQTHINGQVSAEFQEQAQSLIFSQIPETDRAKAYHEYLRCIKKNWNGHKKSRHHARLRVPHRSS